MTITLDGTLGITSPNETTGALTATSVTASGAITAASVTTTGATGSLNSINTFGFKNRIINGGMVIDQRNAGASSTGNGIYSLDRWGFGANVAGKMTWGQNYNSLTPPAGFTNYFGIKTTTAYSVGATDFFLFYQSIEGYNTADLNFGKASAQSITISFWVNSSLTGTFGGVLYNSAQNRAYPFTYTIISANTWEQKTITVVGDSTGTWLTNNGVGLSIAFGLGVGSTYNGTATGSWQSATYLGATGATSVVGTLNATWNITGVQLEKGSVATSFDQRAYSQELAMCQRYYWKGTISGGGVFGGAGGSIPIVAWSFPVTMRATPTLTWISGGKTSNGNVDFNITGVTTGTTYTDSAQILWSQSGSSGANTQGAMTYGAVSSFSAEL